MTPRRRSEITVEEWVRFEWMDVTTAADLEPVFLQGAERIIDARPLHEIEADRLARLHPVALEAILQGRESPRSSLEAEIHAEGITDPGTVDALTRVVFSTAEAIAGGMPSPRILVGVVASILLGVRLARKGIV